MEKQISATERLSRAEQLERLFAQNPDIDVEQARELADSLVKQADSAEAAAANLAKLIKEHDALSAAAGKTKSFNDEIDATLRKFAGLDDEMRKIALTTRLEEILKINPNAFGDREHLEAVVKGIAGIGDEIDKTKTAAEELGMTFSSAFEDAIVQGKGFREILQGIGQDILRIFVRRNISEPSAGFFSDLFSGFLGSTIGGGGSSAGTPNQFSGWGTEGGGAFAGGGTLSYRRTAPMSGQTVINQTFNLGQGTSNSDKRSLMKQVREQTLSAVYESQRRGGLVGA
jgi:hypothetical protein